MLLYSRLDQKQQSWKDSEAWASRGGCESYIPDASCGIHPAAGPRGRQMTQMSGRKRKIMKRRRRKRRREWWRRHHSRERRQRKKKERRGGLEWKWPEFKHNARSLFVTRITTAIVSQTACFTSPTHGHEHEQRLNYRGAEQLSARASHGQQTLFNTCDRLQSLLK